MWVGQAGFICVLGELSWGSQSISKLLFKSLSDRNPDAMQCMQIAHQRRQFREELYFAFTKAC
jgi:hypothetical protein